MKRVFSICLILAMLIVCSANVFASPDTLPEDVSGTTSDLIIVTKPENQVDSTFSSQYIISGYGMGGTMVTLYSFCEEEGIYKKAYNSAEYVDENGETQTMYTAAEVTIGSSGLFMDMVGLEQGENTILVRASNGDHVQYVKLSLTKYSYNIIDLIKSLAA